MSHLPVQLHRVMSCPPDLDIAHACVRIGFRSFQLPLSFFIMAIVLSRIPSRHMLLSVIFDEISCNDEALKHGLTTLAFVASRYKPVSVTYTIRTTGDALDQ